MDDMKDTFNLELVKFEEESPDLVSTLAASSDIKEEFNFKLETNDYISESWEDCKETSNNMYINTDESYYPNEHVEFKIEQEFKYLDTNTESTSNFIECPKCDYKTLKKYNFKKHLVRHMSNSKQDNVKKFKCRQCDFKTAHFYSLKRHSMNHKLDHKMVNENSLKSKKTFFCPECNYEAAFKYLYRHIVHSHEKFRVKKARSRRFIGETCPMCEFTTSYVSNLRRHMIHRHFHIPRYSNISKGCYICYHCGYQTNQKCNLIRHISQIHGTRIIDQSENLEFEYTCEICRFEAISKSDLQIHIAEHHDAPHRRKVYKCNICSYQTIYKTCFDRHSVLHMKKGNVKLHQCYDCSYKTSRKDELKRHILGKSCKNK